MKLVTIYTDLYAQELQDFYLNDVRAHVERETTGPNRYGLVVPLHCAAPKQLADMMQDIILEQNPAVRGQPKLFELLKRRVFEADSRRMAKQLFEHLVLHGRLNVEGYINFRLGHYARRVDAILYSVVKRNLNINTR